MKELNSTPSKRDKKTFLIHQFLFIILLATSYPTSVFSQTYRKIEWRFKLIANVAITAIIIVNFVFIGIRF